MRWVPSAVIRPHRCACIPFVAGNHPEGFFDFGTDLANGFDHVYVSVVAARQMAEKMGWQPAGGVNPLTRKVNALEGEVARLTAERDELARQVEAIGVLKSAGYQAARKPGRPKGKVTA